MLLDAPLDEVKGVGPKTADQLRAAGLRTVRDLIYFLPRTHEDFSHITPISQIRPGKVSVRGHFTGITTKRVRRSMAVTEATLVDDSGKVPVVWFNQGYRAVQLAKDHDWLVSGEFGLQKHRYQLTNPSVEAASGQGISGGRIVPVYRQVAGLKTGLVRKILWELKPKIMAMRETLPAELVKREKLISHAEALMGMHFPETFDDVEQARERLGFEEVLALMLASLKNKQANAKLESHEIVFRPEDAKAFVAKLPFDLTGAQRIAAWEIIKNLSSGEPMNRLLQGDVGSGKTVVAGLVAYIAARAGFQTAFMAPTELLATQHAETLRKTLDAFGIEVALLTGSVKQSARKQLYERIADGSAQLIVGTHALIQDKVVFHELGFVVIDEQHRFGVEQRQRLLAKASKMPHMLAMTATPIPRSLQLTVYGELDISLLGEKPKSRKPIITEIVSPNSRAQMYEHVERELEKGRQAYVICPRIDEADDEKASVEAEVVRLKRAVFKGKRLGKLHGQLPSDEKQAVMQAFADGDIDILVSTTVVEVGVDVPNASVIIIEGADSFGLAQLHQLRGRVGRAEHQSHCFLVPSTSARPSQRLRELERSNDGFYLAEKDLELRGPGEIYGRAQSGALNLAVANIADTRLLRRVRLAAERLMGDEADLVQYEGLMKEVERARRLTTLN